ncbi:hypothetical protein [Streptomyces sp. Da 82-17]|uniref:hypothetical protein n=1 Tax=Streptomyces sp. Da 82-17 TaxID=3377116 RepID=UPI0038D41935
MGGEETPEGGRRRRPGLVAASVAAAVLLAGGGGAYVAANASGGAGAGGPAADETPPPLVLDEDPARGVAPGEPAPGGVTYRAGGELPKGPGSASVHRPRGVVDVDLVARLAEALDVSGTPRAEGTVWKVGRAGDGPVLTVGKEAPGTWSFRAHPVGTDDCVKGKSCTPQGSSGSGFGAGGPGPVSEEDAERAAAPVLEAVGQSDAELDASQTVGAVRVVNADPEVGGLPTYGWSTGVQVGADGRVVGGSGQLSVPEKGAAYPVLSAERTIAELNEAAKKSGPGSGSGGCARPVPLDGGAGKQGLGAGPQGGGSEPSGIAPGEPAPGGGVGPQQPCPPESGAESGSGAEGQGPEPVRVTGATFGLALHFERGRQVLVPSWLFQVRPGGGGEEFTLTHPAVDPKYLAEPRATEPRPEPTEDPGEGGPRTRDVPVTSYSADGRTLTLRFWGGACSEYSARATESGSEVRVAVTEKPQKKGQVCVMIAEERTAEVTLDEPLGERTVVGTDGAAVQRR